MADPARVVGFAEMNPYILLALLAAWAGSVAGAGWWAYGAGQDKCVAESVRDEAVAQIASEAAASAAASAISQIKVTNRTIQNEVQRDVIEKPVYRDAGCRHDADSLQRINAALTGTRPEPTGGGIVPRADASDGRQFRGDDAEAGRSGGPVP